MGEESFRRLIVWQQAMDLVELIYSSSQSFPRSEDYALKSQMRRAAVSIPSNIAEGSARGTKKDHISFLRIAKGSVRELDTQVEIAVRLGYFEGPVESEIRAKLESVGRLLTRLIASLTEAR